MDNFRVVSHNIPCQHIREYPSALANQQEDVLQLAVKQYIPKDNPNPQPGDVTIIGAHANGFPKELYEPLWEDLLSQASKNGWRIRGIWIADVAHQGESGVLNEHLLGNDPNWLDHSRDLLNLINMKRDEMPRPIIGIGHSMGGAQLANLAYIHPRLLTSIVFIDPVIQTVSAEVNPDAPSPSIARLSTFRRSLWPSLDEARTTLLKSPFYRTWDSRVFDRWMKHGLRAVPTPTFPTEAPPQVTLTTTVAQEVFTFVRPNYEAHGVNGKAINRDTHADLNPEVANSAPFYRGEPSAVFHRLPSLRPSALYIFGGLSETSTARMNEAKLANTGVGVGGSGGRSVGKVNGVTFDDIGHLVAMEAPGRTAVEIGTWIGVEMERWREHQKDWEHWTQSRSLQQKQAIDERWTTAMGGRVQRGGGVSKTKQGKASKI